MAAPYRVIATRTFERDFEALPFSVREQIAKALGQLEQSPFGPAADVIDRDVFLRAVGHRRDVYR